MVEETQTPIVETTAEASKGSFNSVVAVEGVPRPLRLHDAKEKNQFGKMTTRIEIGLDDATILEMLPGEDEPELEDGIFRTYMNYAPKSKKPHKNSTYVRGFVKSAEDAKTTWSRLVERGDRVVLRWKEGIELGFKNKVKDADDNDVLDPETGEPVREMAIASCFVLDTSGASVTPIEEHIKTIVLGKIPSIALKDIMTDARAKKQPEWKELLKNDPEAFAKKLGLAQDKDEIFVEA